MPFRTINWRGDRWHRSLEPIVTGILLVVACCTVPSVTSFAEDYSRHCESDELGQGTIANGNYEGTWEIGMKFQATSKNATLTQTIQGKGTFTITVNRSIKVGSPTHVGRSSFRGQAETTTLMDIPQPVSAKAKQRLNGTASLELDGEVEYTTFSVKGPHHTSGTISSRGGSQQQEFDDTLMLTFKADSANCFGAEGTVQSQTLEEMKTQMEEVGYKVESLPAVWKMSRTGDLKEKMQRLRDELNKGAPKNAAGQPIVSTREADARRWAKIADRVKEEEPKEDQDCLMPIWSNYVGKQLEAWGVQDTNSLNKNNAKGDWPALQDQVFRALHTCRGLALSGLDQCSESIYNDLWQAIQGVLERRLAWEIEGGAEPESLLEPLRQLEVFGAISPGMRERTNNTILNHAYNEANGKVEELQKAFAAANLRTVGCEKAMQNPTVMAAYKLAIGAVKAAARVGVDVVGLLERMGCY